MQEAVIVAVLTLAGLIAWATIINLAVKAVCDIFDREVLERNVPAARPHPGVPPLAQLRVGEEPVLAAAPNRSRGGG